MADLENERKELNELCRELIILMGDIEKMEECIAVIKKKATDTYKEIDKKLNGDEK